MDSTRGTLGVAAALWLGLYGAVAVALYALFGVLNVVPGNERAGVALALAIVVTGLALLSVIVDRLVFTREPEDLLTRQTPWVLVLVATTVASTALLLSTAVASPGNAVLFGIAVALPLTVFLFAAVNLARYRTMEHGAPTGAGDREHRD
ncbi:hypothetical protein [Natronorarus salvus]|uniref:hypothetical protein n=1 Tax=Natronorarus salvus TaxID=3117733 RepID=UPI002F261CA8